MPLKYSEFLIHSEILPTAFCVKTHFSPGEINEANLSRLTSGHSECQTHKETQIEKVC